MPISFWPSQINHYQEKMIPKTGENEKLQVATDQFSDLKVVYFQRPNISQMFYGSISTYRDFSYDPTPNIY